MRYTEKQTEFPTQSAGAQGLLQGWETAWVEVGNKNFNLNFLEILGAWVHNFSESERRAFYETGCSK